MKETIEKSNLNPNDMIIKIANTIPDYTNDSEKIKNVATKMILTGTRRLPIVDKASNVVGIVSTMDILDAFLRGMNFNKPISEIMTREIITCNMEEKLDSILQKMIFSKRGGMPILKNKKLVGIVNERNFVRMLYDAKIKEKISTIMSKKPIFLKSGTKINDALKSMVNTHYRRLPIINNGKLVGIVTSMDMLKHFSNLNFVMKKTDDPVDSVASKNVFSIRKDLDISEAIKLMTEKDIGALPVADTNGKLEGIISERNIIEYLM